MKWRTAWRLVAASIPLWAAGGMAVADAMADRVCPLLDQLAASTAGYSPEGVQAQLVMTVADAYDYDPDALAAVLDGVDAATRAACPDARDAVLAGLQRATLSEAMR